MLLRIVVHSETLVISREGFPSPSSLPSYDVEIIRKPDPPIKVAMYRPETKKKLPAFLQVFDYNIDRCERITDKRGLEQAIVLAIASCLDADYDERHKEPGENVLLVPEAQQQQHARSGSSSPLPPQPTEVTLEPNEVYLTPLSEPESVVEHCLRLLKASPGSVGDDRGMGLDLVIIRAQGEEMARRALSISERIKVGFYRLPVQAKGRTQDGTVPEELFLYVRPLEAPQSSQAPAIPARPTSSTGTIETPPASNVRPRIKLGGQSSEPAAAAPSPPAPSVSPSPAPLAGISVYLSKTKLEEFEAEQAQKARLREEKQGRELAQRLAQQQQPQGGGQHLQPPPGGRTPGRSPSPHGTSNSSSMDTDQSVTGDSANGGPAGESVSLRHSLSSNSNGVRYEQEYAQRRRIDVLHLLRLENQRLLAAWSSSPSEQSEGDDDVDHRLYAGGSDGGGDIESDVSEAGDIEMVHHDDDDPCSDEENPYHAPSEAASAHSDASTVGSATRSSFDESHSPSRPTPMPSNGVDVNEATSPTRRSAAAPGVRSHTSSITTAPASIAECPVHSCASSARQRHRIDSMSSGEGPASPSSSQGPGLRGTFGQQYEWIGWGETAELLEWPRGASRKILIHFTRLLHRRTLRRLHSHLHCIFTDPSRLSRFVSLRFLSHLILFSHQPTSSLLCRR